MRCRDSQNGPSLAILIAVFVVSQSLRAELEPHGIGVMAICPGMIDTQIIEGGRMVGEAATRRSKMAATFRRRGAPPSLVADAILDSLRTNPALRTVGRDAWTMHQNTRFAPGLGLAAPAGAR